MTTAHRTPLDHSSRIDSPSVKEIRGVLAPESRDRSTLKGVTYFAISAAVYWLTFASIGLVESWLARSALAVLNGLTVGIVFIVGHDACHGSLTPRSSLNRWLGRLAFLPSLHPYSAWEYSHNALHHGWTNLRGKDPVYCPLTLDEFRALPTWRRRLQRSLRSWLGILPLYLMEIWWKLEIAPPDHHRTHIDKRGTFSFDRAMVLMFPIVQAAVVVAIMGRPGADQSDLAGVLVLSLLVPFLTFNWLIGFATFQHHTHPRVIWYADEQEWNFFRSQVQGTVHVVFPRWIEVALHNIMEHTAHHVDTRVPLYNLSSAQTSLESAFGAENVISEPFSLAGMSRTFRTCQLYDFRTHQWLNFDGDAMTEPRLLA
jgi:omega-6 fatty acid desaturase (delta-12 desaturase)